MLLVAVSADHNGTALKERIASLRLPDIRFIDIGPAHDGRKVDYTDYAQQVGRMVAGGAVERGVLICGTGQGMAMAANRIDGVRAALAHSRTIAALSREHNDSNILCLGAWQQDEAENIEILRLWLAAPFGELRHVKRTAKLTRRLRLVFTNGCFDLVHKGHIELLRWAKALGDKLVVGLDTDESVRKTKGAGRPVTSFPDRKALLEALEPVDTVVAFDPEQRQEMYMLLRPDVVVKGGEWTEAEVRTRDGIPPGIRVMVMPLLDKWRYSTTATIEQVKEGTRG